MFLISGSNLDRYPRAERPAEKISAQSSAPIPAFGKSYLPVPTADTTTLFAQTQRTIGEPWTCSDQFCG
jgi:hypothetical protein